MPERWSWVKTKPKPIHLVLEIVFLFKGIEMTSWKQQVYELYFDRPEFAPRWTHFMDPRIIKRSKEKVAFKAGLGFVWTNMCRTYSMESRSVRRNFKLDLDATNLRPALEQSCVWLSTPSARILFSVKMCYVFFKSKCRGKSDLGLCMSLVVAKRMRLRSANFRFKNMFDRRICQKSALRSRIFFESIEFMHRPRSDSFLHFEIKNTYQIRSEKENARAQRLLPATLLERWPQVYRVKMMFKSLANIWIVSPERSRWNAV